MEVENTHGTGKRIPDLVCFVNGLPWVVIEAKRPDSSHEGKATVSEGISQNIRNQKTMKFPICLLTASCCFLLTATMVCTPHAVRLKILGEMERRTHHGSHLPSAENTPLSQDKLDLLFNHRPAKVRDEYFSLIAGGELVVTDQDRLLVSLLRHDRLLEMTRLFTLFDKKRARLLLVISKCLALKP